VGNAHMLLKKDGGRNCLNLFTIERADQGKGGVRMDFDYSPSDPGLAGEGRGVRTKEG